MDLLLDVNIVLDICLKRQPFYTAARDAIQLCKFQGGKLWLYVGSVQTLQYNLYQEIKRSQVGAETPLKRRQIHERCLALLKTFAEDKHWLAALAAEGNVFSARDPEDEQLLLALDRFGEDKLKLLTRDEPLLNSNPDKAITPQAFIKQSLQVTSDPAIDFIDLKTQQDAIRPELEANLNRVLHHGQYIIGPEVKQLEDKLSEYTEAKHSITVASGTPRHFSSHLWC